MNIMEESNSEKNVAHSKRITRLCPNLRCEWWADTKYYSRTAALGNCVKSLYLYLSLYENLEHLLPPLKTCGALEKLKIKNMIRSEIPSKLFQKLFESPYARLEKDGHL